MFAWQATVQDEQGNAVPLPVVTVWESDGTTLASIYNESGVAIPNPITGTMEGFVQFWAVAGQYKVEGAKGGNNTEVWSVTIDAPAIRAQAWAESPTNPNPSDPNSKSAKTWAGEAEGHANDAAAQVVLAQEQVGLATAERQAAEAARDAAIAAGSWTYTVDTAADLAGLSPSPDDTALVLDTMHVWRWDGSEWIDTGESPLAVKADLVAGNMVLQSEIQDNTTLGGSPNSAYFRTAAMAVIAGASYALPVMTRRGWYGVTGNLVATPTPAPGPAVEVAPAGAVALRLEGYKVVGTRPDGMFDVRQNVALAAPVDEGSHVAQSQYSQIPGNRIAHRTIHPDALLQFAQGKNLFNPAEAMDGYYDPPNLPIQTNATYCYSALIPVTEGQQYTGNLSMRFVAYYGPNGDKLTTGLSTAATTFTPPAGVHFAVVTVAAATKSLFQLEAGAVATGYEPYGYDALTVLPNGAEVRYPDSGSAPAQRPERYGIERLRETRQRLTKLRMGGASRLTMAFIGDSWTHRPERFSGKTAQALWDKYHSGDVAPLGRGFIGFATAGTLLQNGSITGLNQVTQSGTWTNLYPTGNGPDACAVVSSEAGASLTAALDYSRGLSWTLFVQGGAGAVRYRWTDGGGWTSIDLSALPNAFQALPLSGAPGSGSGNFSLQIVTGTARLYGLVEIKSGDGIVAHKLGATGSNTAQWVALDATIWQAGLAALAPDLVVIMHGTNDQTGGRTPAAFRSNLLTIIDRVRAARPTCDVLLIAPCENQRTSNPVPMSGYADVMWQIARNDRDVAFGDLQPHFGVVPADYAAGSGRPWFNADLIHPEPDTGGFAMSAAGLSWMGE